MKKFLTFAMILSLLLSILTLPAMADETVDSVENYTALTHHGTERPDDFQGAELFDFYWYTDGVGLHENAFTSADGLTSFEYVYLKAYEGEDKSTAFPKEEAYILTEFDVPETGVYDFLIEVMAFETAIPRTGLIQIDDGEKFYLSATHGTNHETFEYFSGLSAYLTKGEHTITIYLAPDFDDSTVKSLFFDNFYYLLDEDAELPEDTTPPMWDEKKQVVSHQSFDELRKNGDGNDGVFAPGQSGTWDMIAAIDSNTDKLDYWGWVGLKGDIGSFGYQIDGNAPVYDDAFTVEAEQAVLDAAVGAGGTTASRMLIGVDVSELEGEHTVRILYKDAAGNVVSLNVFTVNRTAAPETAPESDEQAGGAETTPDTTEGETNGDVVTPDSAADTSADTSANTPADTAAEDEGGCASSIAALSVSVAALAAAFLLRRKED